MDTESDFEDPLSDKLLHAAEHADYDSVQKLIKSGAAFKRDKLGRTALHHCATNAKGSKIAELLLRSRCPANLLDENGLGAIHYAVHSGHYDVVQALADGGVNVQLPDKAGNTPLHAAAWNGYSKSVKILLEHNCNPNIQNKDGFTALHMASQRGHNECTRLLLLAGCDPELRNMFGDTALHTTARYRHAGVTKILLSAHCNPNATNQNNDTSLHICAALRHRKIARLLLERPNLNLQLRNNQNETALDTAKRKEHWEIGEWINEYSSNRQMSSVQLPTIQLQSTEYQRLINQKLKESKSNRIKSNECPPTITRQTNNSRQENKMKTNRCISSNTQTHRPTTKRTPSLGGAKYLRDDIDGTPKLLTDKRNENEKENESNYTNTLDRKRSEIEQPFTNNNHHHLHQKQQEQQQQQQQQQLPPNAGSVNNINYGRYDERKLSNGQTNSTRTYSTNMKVDGLVSSVTSSLMPNKNTTNNFSTDTLQSSCTNNQNNLNNKLIRNNIITTTTTANNNNNNNNNNNMKCYLNNLPSLPSGSSAAVILAKDLTETKKDVQRLEHVIDDYRADTLDKFRRTAHVFDERLDIVERRNAAAWTSLEKYVDENLTLYSRKQNTEMDRLRQEQLELKANVSAELNALKQELRSRQTSLIRTDVVNLHQNVNDENNENNVESSTTTITNNTNKRQQQQQSSNEEKLQTHSKVNNLPPKTPPNILLNVTTQSGILNQTATTANVSTNSQDNDDNSTESGYSTVDGRFRNSMMQITSGNTSYNSSALIDKQSIENLRSHIPHSQATTTTTTAVTSSLGNSNQIQLLQQNAIAQDASKPKSSYITRFNKFLSGKSSQHNHRVNQVNGNNHQEKVEKRRPSLPFIQKFTKRDSEPKINVNNQRTHEIEDPVSYDTVHDENDNEILYANTQKKRDYFETACFKANDKDSQPICEIPLIHKESIATNVHDILPTQRRQENDINRLEFYKNYLTSQKNSSRRFNSNDVISVPSSAESNKQSRLPSTTEIVETSLGVVAHPKNNVGSFRSKSSDRSSPINKSPLNSSQRQFSDNVHEKRFRSQINDVPIEMLKKILIVLIFSIIYCANAKPTDKNDEVLLDRLSQAAYRRLNIFKELPSFKRQLERAKQVILHRHSRLTKYVCGVSTITVACMMTRKQELYNYWMQLALEKIVNNMITELLNPKKDLISCYQRLHPSNTSLDATLCDVQFIKDVLTATDEKIVAEKQKLDMIKLYRSFTVPKIPKPKKTRNEDLAVFTDCVIQELEASSMCTIPKSEGNTIIIAGLLCKADVTDCEKELVEALPKLSKQCDGMTECIFHPESFGITTDFNLISSYSSEKVSFTTRNDFFLSVTPVSIVLDAYHFTMKTFNFYITPNGVFDDLCTKCYALNKPINFIAMHRADRYGKEKIGQPSFRISFVTTTFGGLSTPNKVRLLLMYGASTVHPIVMVPDRAAITIITFQHFYQVDDPTEMGVYDPATLWRISSGYDLTKSFLKQLIFIEEESDYDPNVNLIVVHGRSNLESDSSTKYYEYVDLSSTTCTDCTTRPIA
ncbi:hypothetical protein SNEBB_002091 [Seison nebaliae]|nr:hypothetical protein SNEBB_002091 [Seison nebaliae]